MSALPSTLTVITQADDCRLVWRKAHDAWRQPSPFLHPAFQEGLERLVSWDRVVVLRDGEPILSGFVRSRGPVKDLVLPPFQPYSAVVPGLEIGEVADSLIATPGLPANWLLSLAPARPVSGASHAENGYSIKERNTYILASAPMDSAIAAWSAGPRRQVRKATADYRFWCSHDKSGDAQSEANKLDEVIYASVRLADQAYSRHNRSLPLPPRGLARWARDLVYADLARVYGLYERSSGEVVAAIVALHDHRTAWYWIAGSEPGPGMTVLMAHVQDDLYQAGIPTLDLMGANTPGIAEFKRRFGGVHVTYVHLVKRSLAGRFTETAANLFRGFVPKDWKVKHQRREGT